MASPVVCVLIGRNKKGGVRLAIDYRFLNASSTSDEYILPHLSDLKQKVGKKRFISSFECQSGYWQLSTRESDRYLPSFAYDGGQYEWTRMDCQRTHVYSLLLIMLAVWAWLFIDCASAAMTSLGHTPWAVRDATGKLSMQSVEGKNQDE